MSQKVFSTTNHRSAFEKDVYQDAIIYTYTFNVGGTATKITNAALTSFGLSAAFASTATQLSFDTLAGNLPWSSYSKFATPTNARTTNPSIPIGSVPQSGAITITEGGVGTEIMYYGSVTWASATTGTLNNIKRASTAYTFTGAATGTFTNVVPIREYIKIWNRTGGILYIGDSQAINTTPTNAVRLAPDGEWGIWLEPLQDIWVVPAVGGVINIAEYR